jgi:uncharacterized protein YajQ (UPF0234 family)
MAKDASFDIVSQVDMALMTDAVHQALKEIESRFDLKGTGCNLELEKSHVTAQAPDDFKLRNIVEILEQRMVKRGLTIKALKHGKVESALGGTFRQELTIQQGISKEMAKTLTGAIKESKIKVQAQIQDDQIRVTGKSRDDLQAVIALLKKKDLEIDLQFINYR